MCTAITLQDSNNNAYFGRTMDFSYKLNPSLFYCPRNFLLANSLSSNKIRNKYAFMGIGQQIPKFIFTEGVNEKGLAIAALYFPNFATYNLPPNSETTYQIDSLEMVNFILGNCATLDEVAYLVPQVAIIGVPDSITNSIAPLHWMVTDTTGNSLVIENQHDGLHLLQNPIGVLSNSPNFEWHMTNLQNYMNLSPIQQEKTIWNSVILTPFGQGAGTLGLPGDYTPPSRFVRASFLKSHIEIPNTQKESVLAFFHLIKSVSIPKGIVITKQGNSDYTQYASFIDLQTKEYFYQTYNNTSIIQTNFPSFSEQTHIIEIKKMTSTL